MISTKRTQVGFIGIALISYIVMAFVIALFSATLRQSIVYWLLFVDALLYAWPLLINRSKPMIIVAPILSAYIYYKLHLVFHPQQFDPNLPIEIANQIQAMIKAGVIISALFFAVSVLIQGLIRLLIAKRDSIKLAVILGIIPHLLSLILFIIPQETMGKIIESVVQALS